MMNQNKNFTIKLLSERFIELLAILFIYLKLTEQIDWSWFWVLSPIWGNILLIIILFIIWGISNSCKKSYF